MHAGTMSAIQMSTICQYCWPSRALRIKQTAWAPSQMSTGQSLFSLIMSGPALNTVACFSPRIITVQAWPGLRMVWRARFWFRQSVL